MRLAFLSWLSDMVYYMYVVKLTPSDIAYHGVPIWNQIRSIKQGCRIKTAGQDRCVDQEGNNGPGSNWV